MDLLSLQPGSQIFSRNLPPRAAVQGVALVSWVFWDRGYFLRLLLFLLRFPSQPATREGLSALSPPLRTPCLLPFPSLFCITSPLLSRGQAILASRTPGQTGLCRAAHSSGRSAGDSSAKWPELMTSRPAGLARRESWASACREKKKKSGALPPGRREDLHSEAQRPPDCVRQTITWKTTFYGNKEHTKKPLNSLLLPPPTTARLSGLIDGSPPWV